MSHTKRLELLEDRTRARRLLAEALLRQKRPEEAAKVLRAAVNESWEGAHNILLEAELGEQYRKVLKQIGQTDPDLPDIEADIELGYKNERLCSSAFNDMRGGKFGNAARTLIECQRVSQSSKNSEAVCRCAAHQALLELLKNNLESARKKAVVGMNALSPNKKEISKHTSALCLGVFALAAADTESEAKEKLRQALEQDHARATMFLHLVLDNKPQLQTRCGMPVFDLIWGQASMMSPSERVLVVAGYPKTIKKGSESAFDFYVRQSKRPVLTGCERAYNLNCAIANAHGKRAEDIKKLSKQAIQLRKGDPTHPAETTANYLCYLAEDSLNIQQYDEVIEYAKKGLGALRPEESLVKARLFSAIGLSHAGLGQWDEALSNIDNSIELYKKNASIPGVSDSIKVLEAIREAAVKANQKK